MNIDSAFCEVLREKMEVVFSDLGEEMGVTITVGSMRYSSDHVKVSSRVDIPNEVGGSQKGAEDFTRLAHHYGLRAEDLGKEFEYGGHKYRLVGANPRAPKYPIQGMRLDGKRAGEGWRLPPAAVVNALPFKVTD